MSNKSRSTFGRWRQRSDGRSVRTFLAGKRSMLSSPLSAFLRTSVQFLRRSKTLVACE